MSERDGIRLAIECVNRHNHGFIKCHPMFIRGHNEAVKAITKELWSLIETAPIGGDYFEGFSEGVKVGRQETDNALREELAAVTERMSKLDFERTAAELERDALREENARLRAALKPFADVAEQVGDEDARWAVPSAYLRAAAAAILGKVKDEAACPEPDEAP